MIKADVSGNLTLPSSLHQHFLFSFNLTLLLLSLTFNLTVLYGAIRRQALKSDISTVLLLEILAILDLLISLFSVLPMTVTSWGGRWMLGEVWCVVTALTTRYLYLAELLILSYISLHRLRLVLVRKGRRGNMQRRKNRALLTRIAVTVVLLLPLLPVLDTFLGNEGRLAVEFVPGLLGCFPVENSYRLGSQLSFCYLVLTSTTVLVSNQIILYKVVTIRMQSKSMHRVGFFTGLKNAINPGTVQKCISRRVRKISASTYVTILFLCIIFVISYCPVFYMIHSSGGTMRSGSGTHWLGVVTVELLSLGVLTNPAVYTLSNMRFRRYIVGLIGCKSRKNAKILGPKRKDPEEQSSGDHIFNETLSKFFSTATRKTSLVSLSVLRSGSRSSLGVHRSDLTESRLGTPRSRRTSNQSGPGTIRKSSSSRSIMPHVEEGQALCLFTPRTPGSPFKTIPSDISIQIHKLSGTSSGGTLAQSASSVDMRAGLRSPTKLCSPFKRPKRRSCVSFSNDVQDSPMRAAHRRVGRVDSPADLFCIESTVFQTKTIPDIILCGDKVKEVSAIRDRLQNPLTRSVPSFVLNGSCAMELSGYSKTDTNHLQSSSIENGNVFFSS